jgi:hypothetical protein
MVMLVMGGRSCSSEWRFQGCLARILLPVIHLLEELFRLLLVDEGQAGLAVLQLKGMEEDAVLVVVPILVDFLIPYYPPVSGLAAS